MEVNAEDLNRKTADRIRELRESRNLSYRKFGELVGVTKSTIFRWESGDLKTMKMTFVKQIADEFNVNPVWLFGYDVPKYRELPEHEQLRKDIEDRLVDMSIDNLKKIKDIIEVLSK